MPRPRKEPANAGLFEKMTIEELYLLIREANKELQQEGFIRAEICKDACQGIPSEALKSGVVGEMVEQLKYISELLHGGHNYSVSKRQIDDILSKLEGK